MRHHNGSSWLLLFLAPAFAAAACAFPKAGPPPAPLSAADVSAAKSKWPDVTDASLARGRDVFLAKCNGCHHYPDLSAIPEERWPEIVGRMSEKAGLDSGQEESVLRFVLAARARSST